MKIIPYITLYKPSKSYVERVKASSHGYNHPHICVTRAGPPLPDDLVQEGWTLDHRRFKVGNGKHLYESTKEFLKHWAQFQLGWTEVDPTTPVTPGTKLAVVSHTLCMWTSNPLQIVYADESRGTSLRKETGERVKGSRYTFAQGTLEGHLLKGEESFAVEHHNDDSSVWFELYTFSKPAHPLAVLTYPLVRFQQRRFGREVAHLIKQNALGADFHKTQRQ